MLMTLSLESEYIFLAFLHVSLFVYVNVRLCIQKNNKDEVNIFNAGNGHSCFYVTRLI